MFLVMQAAPAAIATMAATFPNSMQEDNFIKAAAAELRNLGFRRSAAASGPCSVHCAERPWHLSCQHKMNQEHGLTLAYCK